MKLTPVTGGDGQDIFIGQIFGRMNGQRKAKASVTSGYQDSLLHC